jgi:hypothetical protein
MRAGAPLAKEKREKLMKQAARGKHRRGEGRDSILLRESARLIEGK